jgi:hypothetical protein
MYFISQSRSLLFVLFLESSSSSSSLSFTFTKSNYFRRHRRWSGGGNAKHKQQQQQHHPILPALKMVKDLTIIVAASSSGRGIGYQGQLVRFISVFFCCRHFLILVLIFSSPSFGIFCFARVIHIAMEVTW